MKRTFQNGTLIPLLSIVAFASVLMVESLTPGNVFQGKTEFPDDVSIIKGADTWTNFTYLHLTDANWSVAAGFDWCSGNGSVSNPYWIENFTINGQTSPTGSCIIIENSTAHFVIHNCIVYNAPRGITLKNVTNGNVTGNLCSGNTNGGIYLQNMVHNSTISWNTCDQNGNNGIYVYNSSHNNITNNTAINNGAYGIIITTSSTFNTISSNNVSDTINAQDYGIYLSQSHNNTVTQNQANSLVNHGILLGTSHQNNVSWNECNSNGDHGIYLSNGDDNIIQNNTCNSNSDEGIYLYAGSDRNAITGNQVLLNINDGIHLYSSCHNNTITWNDVHDNYDYGVYVWTNCDNNGIRGNNCTNRATTNQNYGIFVTTGCDNATITGNNAENNVNGGIYVYSSDNPTIENNTVESNAMRGISLASFFNATVRGNIFTNEGLVIDGALANYNNSIISTTNLVNGKPIYYYFNAIGLNASNFTNAGQVFLVNCSNALLSDLDLSGASIGITAINTNSTTFHNITASTNIYGMYLRYSCMNNTVVGCRFSSNTYGIYSNNQVTNHTVYNSTFTGNTYGLCLYDFEASAVYNNTFSNSATYGIYLATSSTGVHVLNNSFTTNDYAIYLTSAGNCSIKGNIINTGDEAGISIAGGAGKNNTVEYNTITGHRYGIYIVSSANNNTFRNNLVRGSTNHGFYVYSGAQYNRIECNTIIDNNAQGMYMRSLASHNIIHNNTIRNLFTTVQSYGIYIYESCANNTISNNTIGYHTTTGIYLNGLPAGQTVTGNVLIDQLNGIFSVNSNNTVFTWNRFLGCGFHLESMATNFSSLVLGTDNTVNGKPVYLFINKNGLTNANVTNAGQVILVDCDDASFSGLDVSNGTTGVGLLRSVNVTLEGITATDCRHGIFIYQGSHNATVLSSTGSDSYYGLYLSGSESLRLESGNYDSCAYGIYLANTHFSSVESISASSATNYGIENYNGDWCRIENNTCNGNQDTGIYLYSVMWNTVINNTCKGNLDNGIELYYHCDNNTIANNTLQNNGDYGAYIWSYSNGNDIRENTINNNYYGVYFYSYSNHNRLEHNIIFDNTYYGALVSTNSNDVYIQGNIISNVIGSNQNTGIYIIVNSYRATIVNNTMSRNVDNAISLNNADYSNVIGNSIGNSSGASYGIAIASVDYCTCTGNIIQNTQYGVSLSSSTYNRLADNTVTGSSLYGFFLGANCDNNNFTGNTVANLTGTAVRVDAGTSNNNLFFLNYFINCVIYGVDNALGNAWDNGSLGNYWGDYSGPDNDLNAIGDTPYTFNIYGNDSYPVLITDSTYLVDLDGDGLNGYLEINGIANPYGNVPTDPNDPDSDGDGIEDGEEVYAGLDGQVTNPNSNDTDGDMLPDQWEIQNGFDATSALDAASDTDADSLTVVEEFGAGTDPRDEDTDDDMILDGEELIPGIDGYITDPLVADTDEDAFSDGLEISLGTSPLNANSYPKPDVEISTTWVIVNGTLNVTITNTGNWIASSVQVMLTVVSSTSSYSDDSYAFITVPATTSIAFLVDFSSLAPALLANTTYTATITIAPANVINEIAEDNNVLGNVTFVYLPASPVTPGVPPGFIPMDIFLIIVGILAGVIAIVGMISGVMVHKAKKQLRGAKSPSLANEMKDQGKAPGYQTPALGACFVHQGPVISNPYTCPACKAMYCPGCIQSLKARGQKCWSCGADLV